MIKKLTLNRVSNSNLRFILTLLFFVSVLVFGLWYFSNITTYFLIAVIISSIGRPITEYLSWRNVFGIPIPRSVAVIITFAILIGFIIGFVTVFVPLIGDQIKVLRAVDPTSFKNSIRDQVEPIETWIINLKIAELERGFILETIVNTPQKILERIRVQDVVSGLLAVTGNLFTGVLAVSFISFFLLYERGKIIAKTFRFIPNRYFELFISVYYKIQRLLNNYLLGLILQMLLIFTLAGLGLEILGIKYALTIALFAAVANLIPYIGPFLGSSFGILTSIITNVGEVSMEILLIIILKIVIVFASVQIMDNIILQPIIFSRSVKAHPLEIFVIIFVGAALGGVVGMIAAIPVYTIGKVSLLKIRDGLRDYHTFNQ